MSALLIAAAQATPILFDFQNDLTTDIAAGPVAVTDLSSPVKGTFGSSTITLTSSVGNNIGSSRDRGANSGPFGDITRDFIQWNIATPITITISGLKTDQDYTFRLWSGDLFGGQIKTTDHMIAGASGGGKIRHKSVSLADENATGGSLVVFPNVVSTSTGTLTYTIHHVSGGGTAATLNGFELAVNVPGTTRPILTAPNPARMADTNTESASGSSGMVPQTPTSMPRGVKDVVAGESSFKVETIWLSSDKGCGSSQFKVSVHPYNAGYYGLYSVDGTPPLKISTDPFFDPITAYRFWHVKTPGNVDTMAQSDVIIGDLHTPDKNMQADHNFLQLWESTDPQGIDFSTPADYTKNTTVANIQNASGTIDIKDIAEGGIYFIYGGYNSMPKLTVRISGSETARDIDLGDVHNADNSNNSEFYLAFVDFVNANGYTTVKWAISSVANARFCGIVVTEPQPKKSQ